MNAFILGSVITVSLLVTGCSIGTVKLVQVPEYIHLEVAPTSRAYIRFLKVTETDKGFSIWGRVKPGRRSNIYRPYIRHIDIVDKESGKLILKVGLGPKTERFTRGINLVKGAKLLALYYKERHSQHMIQTGSII